MKQIFGNICRASVAAAGVMVATSAASAESRPVLFETEFDLDVFVGGIAFEAPAVAPQVSAPLTLDVASAAAGWEQAIGAYLDALLDATEAKEAKSDDAKTDAAHADAATQPAPAELAVATEVVIAPLVAAEVAAFTAPAVRPELLAPVLSHPMHCDQCLAHAAEAAAAETASATAVDDDAAWQSLADWAAARAAESAPADDALTAESDFFFDDEPVDNEPTQ